MALSDKSRKLLWGRSGSLCALCKQKLIFDTTAKDDESVVGDECHIVSPRAAGPRHDKDFPTAQFDLPSNLILLCKTHHKLVDDQPETFTASILSELRVNHERWVADRLSPKNKRGKDLIEDPPFLARVFNGKQLLSFIVGAYQFGFSNDELQDQDEVRLVSGFFQSLQDSGDMWDVFDAGMRVRIEFDLTDAVNELARNEFWVFAGRRDRKASFGGTTFESWPTAYVQVSRSSNPEIINLQSD